ncbi:MAG TPA: DNA polymerase/3'-5' exonuclease PolX [Bacteroidota bacterium]|nr:DNA polymerase/3'-5' exonuclease PolX [Bacteroidota bacterium]
MQNREIADILEEMAILLEILGENPFKCRAFHNASRLISSSTEEMKTRAAGGTLTGLKGIGKGLAPVISDLALKGKSDEVDRLRASVPAGLLDMMKVQGLGPKRVRLLYEKLGINSLDKLRKAASGDLLDRVGGFGAKSRANILKNLDLLKLYQGKSLIREAEATAESLLGIVAALPGVAECGVAGSLRRRMPVIGDIDLLAGAPARFHRGIISGFTAIPDAGRVLSSGSTRCSVVLGSGMQCDLRVVTVAEYPFALQYFTGSREHNVKLRARATDFGWSLNEYGFTAVRGKSRAKPRVVRGRKSSPVKPPQCLSESDVYNALGLGYIPPELREDTGEIAAATGQQLPRLVETTDLRGTFHCHTTYSDGRNTLGGMARAAKELGWEYLGIADHSRAAAYAGGLSGKDVARQIGEIHRLNGDQEGFRIFSGTEVDILSDGTLDWNDRTLALFDYVVASVHSWFNMTDAEATKRIIGALKNKHVTMLGHPTGRLLLERDGYPLKMKEVIEAAADYGKMIEINANPRRMDLDWSHCRYARDRGVLIAINPDAHSVAGLGDVRFGIDVARKGWLGPRDVFNTKTLAGVARILAR